MIELLKLASINNLVIKLIESKQIFYSPIYSLELIELETLKIHIETNLTNASIRPFKSTARAPMFIFLEVMNF